MREELRWLTDALASKEIVQEMTHYKVKDGTVSATNGRLTASHPFPYDGEFLVPGKEMEKVLDRMPDEPELSQGDDHITIKSGRFRGKIATLPMEEWDYPGVDEAAWQPIPGDLWEIMKELRPFVSDNATQPWATCVALSKGWVYATNNISLAGAYCEGLADIDALLPFYAVDFVLGRQEGLVEWAWADNFVGFRWENGAWMRSQLVIGSFPQKAMEMVQQSKDADLPQEITDGFREAFDRIAGLTESKITLHADKIVGIYKRAEIEESAECAVPDDPGYSHWASKYLVPVIQVADVWDPASWPKPSAFKGGLLHGYVIGRNK